jgi:hypothetical protein
LEEITFTNTACGTENVASLLSVGEDSGMYTIALENGSSYNVSISWNRVGNLVSVSDMGSLVLDSLESSMQKDWLVQPQSDRDMKLLFWLWFLVVFSSSLCEALTF